MMSLVRHVIGVTSFVLFAVNTLFWIIPVIALSLLKFLLPIPVIRRIISGVLNWSASCWITLNSLLANNHCRINVEWPEDVNFSRDHWYLVIANHQSWVDIYILQRLFNRKIPFLKFFLKQQLIFVPFLGVAWWALDFPFMKRHTKAYLKKYPHKKGQDLETTKRACEKFKHIPISVMNFVEGTRFTAAKAKRQNSPFQHLLKPKSGGVGTVLSILGEQMHTVVDVTIHYPEGSPSFWDFLTAKISDINVVIKVFEIDPTIIGDMTSNETRIKVQSWLNEVWQSKDAQLQRLTDQHNPSSNQGR